MSNPGTNEAMSDEEFDNLIVLDPRVRETYRRLRRQVIENERVEAVARGLGMLFDTNKTGLETEVGLIYGKPGVGKSTAVQSFCSKWKKPIETPSGTKRPVLLVQTPSKPTEIKLYQALLCALDCEDMIGPLKQMKFAFTTQASLQKVRLVIFDEFQHVVEDRTDKAARVMVREVKQFINLNLFNIAFVGTPDLVEVHKLYDQIGSRNAFTLLVAAYDIELEDDWQDWKEIVDLLLASLAFATPTDLTDRLAQRFHKATDGRMRTLVKLLALSAAEALDDGADGLREAHLWRGFESIRAGLANPKSGNPFAKPPRAVAKARILLRDDLDEDTGLRSRGRKPSRERAFAK